MTTDEPAAPSGGTVSKAKPLPFDTSVANQARMYDYLLGRKIQVVQTSLPTPDMTNPRQRSGGMITYRGFAGSRTPMRKVPARLTGLPAR
jgi:hypothetical protein